MDLRVTTSRVDPDIVVLHLTGHIAVEWILRSLLGQGERKLIFDLASVDRIDADAVNVQYGTARIEPDTIEWFSPA